MGKLDELAKLGQAIWLDYIRREFITSGELQALIDNGLRGMTSNPSIFEKAISGSSSSSTSVTGEYDADIERLAKLGRSPLEIYEALAVEDIQRSADLLHPIYEKSGGLDGYVSLEVNPTLAYDEDSTISEAKRLWELVDRSNLMIKIPATKAGLPAISHTIADGINVNVTLIFSLKRYEEVMDAFLSGMEKRLREGKPIDRLASVASFFVSRLDTKVDEQLEQIMRKESSRSVQAASLQGKAAVANAKLAYSLFQGVFTSPRFTRLADKGARPQRPLWASTSTKNPAYPDILYVQELIGAHTVNTLPQNTLEAFFDHGIVRVTITEETDQARMVMEKLENLGVSLDQVTKELESEGVDAFSKSFIALLNSIEQRKKVYLQAGKSSTFSLGSYAANYESALLQIARDEIIPRIWREDYTVWKPEPTEINNRLGWLNVHEEMVTHLPRIEAIHYAIQSAGYTQGLLLGMGGSSLAPEMFSKIFAYPSSPQPLQISVLDSTDPGQILLQTEKLDLAKTLFIVSTKSGSTEETISLFKYFYNLVSFSLGEQEAGDHFIAITDPGSKLVEIARTFHFRAVFLNDPQIGGRYSALSYFGLVPAAFLGVDLARLLSYAASTAHVCKVAHPIDSNPAACLGTAIGELAKAGRDKLTFVLSPSIVSFADWLEQLIAESTGKEGVGILPVVGETLGTPDLYGEDRVFISIYKEDELPDEERLAVLESAGHPIIRIAIDNLYELGGQFVLWEMATAIAGYRMGIHPFNQPNVEAAKTLARERIAAYKQTGQLAGIDPVYTADDIAVYADIPSNSLASALAAFIARGTPGDYIAIQAFLTPEADNMQELQSFRLRLREQTHLATTLGFGPRYLHSTGQLHKGDRGNGLFIQFTADDPADLPIPDQAGQPGSSVTFGVLKQAQALGDYEALLDGGRRVIRFHLHGDIAQKIHQLTQLIPG